MEKLKKRLQDGHAVDEKGYFESYRGNIFRGRMSIEFQDMFNAGSGDELRTKAEAVHSSSMLSYNFFHWINEKNPLKWENVEYNKVLFELKLKTIRKSNAPANMDVVLIDKDGENMLLIESKFLEYTKKESFELSEGYNNPQRWFTNDVEWSDITKNDYDEKYLYKGGIKQLITHLLGIHNLRCEEKEIRDYVKKQVLKSFDEKKKDFDFKTVHIKFITLIFEPKEKEFKDEYSAYKNYNELFEIFKNKLEGRGLDVIPQWVSYSTLWEGMKGQIKEKELRAFLWERYMRFAEGTEE